MCKRAFQGLCIVVFATMTSGCASMTHYNNVETAGDKKVFFIDAKQRGVYSVKKTEGSVSWEGICAEPSPDAISSLAATLGVDLTLTDKGKLGVSQSIAEGVGSIGIRTAAIEALRDIMYRNCEAYALGGMSSVGLETLQRRFQSTMVAILAIEQLTGAVRAPSVVISGSSSAGSPDAIVDLTNKTEVARKAIDDAKSAETKSKEKYDGAATTRKDTEKKIDEGKAEAERIRALQTPTTEEKKKLTEYDELTKTLTKNKEAEEASKKEYEGAQATTKGREQAFAALDASRTAALTGGGKSSLAGQIEALGTKPALSDEAAKAVATAVVNIVKTTTSELPFSNELCTTLLGQYPNVTPLQGSALEACKNRLSGGQMLK